MFASFFKIQLRNLIKRKGHAIINLLGLAVGLASCLAIMVWVQDELSYDRFHDNGESLYRMWVRWDYSGEPMRSSLTPAVLAAALKQDVPEVVRATRFNQEGKQFIKHDGRSFYDEELALADPDFLDMFSFPLTRGDKETALADRYSLIVTESMAARYFGRTDPVGQVLNINRQDFTVTAVMKDIPANSHMRFDCLAHFDSRPQYLIDITENWNVSAYYTYVQLSESATIEDVSAKSTAVVEQNRSKHEGATVEFDVQPIARIHLHHEITDYLEGHGDILYVYLFSALAVLLLLVAGINYMNLTTARATERAREIGLRKMVGASRLNLIRQLLIETLTTTIVAVLLAVVLVEAFLPVLSDWSGKQLQFSPFTDFLTLSIITAIVVLTTLLAGSYPAFILSAYIPATVLKGRIYSNPSGVLFRRLMVIGQFVASIVLIVGALTIQNQLNYIRDKELGFDKSNLLYMDMRGKFRQLYPEIKQQLTATTGIADVTAGRPPLTGYNSAFYVRVNGRLVPDDYRLGRSPVDADFIETMAMEIIDGRSFSPDGGDAPLAGFVLNETAITTLGPDVSVGSHLAFYGHSNTLDTLHFEGYIIGIVKDFHYRPLTNSISPVIMYHGPEELYDICIRVVPGQEQQAIAAVKVLWETHASEYPFEYQFVDDTIDEFYRTEARLKEMFGVFTALAVFISCLGLVGLASHAADRRVKEIGIRRVLGASVGNIVKLMSTEFVVLVMLASLVAVPAAWYVTGKWLEQFAYRVEIGWGLFALAILLAVLMAAATVGVQAVRAASANPIDSLRYE
ncbi:MAG: ABC transporter permease [Candidatus Zixiibacteriota bacterium]|nr:MAG: ABC transporter permease [candidate division Zixibacteria bacterium]